MADLWKDIVLMLILLRDQCMPVTIGDTPGPIDYAVVGLASLGMVAGTLWFVWGLLGRDSGRHDAVKSQILED